MRGFTAGFIVGTGALLVACSGSEANGGANEVGGARPTGGASASTAGQSSTSAATTTVGSGGRSSVSSASTGGKENIGGAGNPGGSSSAPGGASGTGGSPSGGRSNSGGNANSGGTAGTSKGGSNSVLSGGTSSTPVGGTSSSAPMTTAAGHTGSGGSLASVGGTSPVTAAGNSGTGGSPALGGSTSSGGAAGSASTGGSAALGGSPASGGTSNTGGSSATTTVSIDCSDTATATGNMTVRYDAAEIPVTGKQKSYIAHTNWWHTWNSQAIAYNGLSLNISDSKKTSVPASDGAPTGFPSMFIGRYSGKQSQGSNLPKAVTAIKSVPTIFSTDSSAHDTSNFNATYDVWFTAKNTPLDDRASDPGADGALLMVWLFKPKDRQPRGGQCSTTDCTPDVPNHTVAGVSQPTWDVWLGPGNGRAPCVSYVSTTPLDSLSFDLNLFIQDAVANNYYLKGTMSLSIVFAGFEIWGGGDGLQLKQYCAQVN